MVHCTPSGDYLNRRTDRYDDYDRSRSSRGDSRSGGGGLRNLNQGKVSFSRWKPHQFDGEDCQKSPECRSQCDEIFDTSKACHNLPAEMVELLYQNYIAFKNPQLDTRDYTIKDLDPSALATIADFDRRYRENLMNLFRDEWSLSQVTKFLISVASSKVMVEAVRDSSYMTEFFETALNTLSKDQITAFATDLNRSKEVFLLQAQQLDNHSAFELVFHTLNQHCEDPERCKRTLLCKREMLSDSRDGHLSCPYINPNQRDRRDYCYLHGLNVWDYLNEKLQNGQIRDSHLSNSRFSEDECNQFCQKTSCNL